MIETIDQLDKSIFHFLNGINSPFWDTIMIAITGKLIWIPFYAFLLYLLIKALKKKAIPYIIALPLLIIWADRISSGLAKPGFERLRPCHETTLTKPVHSPDGCGGQYGYFSSHASNTFAIASFLFFCLRRHYSKISLLFIWAFIVSYSRIYLGVHYPGDVLTGSIFGTLSGWLFFYLTKAISKKIN